MGCAAGGKLTFVGSDVKKLRACTACAPCSGAVVARLAPALESKRLRFAPKSYHQKWN